MIKFLGPPIKRVGPKQKSIVLEVGMRLALRKSETRSSGFKFSSVDLYI